MPVALNRDIRKILEDVVKKARVAAEAGALTALGRLGVADARKPSWLTEDEAALRVRLRAHAKTLDDPLDTGDPARMPRLVREIAYAHWHRALFARFLLENGLLVDVEAGNAPVRPDELREIAQSEGKDVAEVAAEFAQPMLPEIFPADDPVSALPLPPETRQAIAALVDGLPAQTFKADDSLGWTYQFWQADRKKRVNESEVKIGADELPAVTQLFTEDYMVLFLLENTLGAWWAGKRLAETPDLAHSARDEDELRRRLSPAGYTWTYLRFVREGDGDDALWRPAAGTFPGWPARAAEITVLDPCMGSGHFLVFALDILTALRRAEEGLDETGAVTAVLRDNLHGLEIDPRCTQIAAFALALAAWKRMGGVRRLPPLHLACSGLPIGMGKDEFVRLAEKIAEAEGFGGGAADLLGRARNPMEESALARRRGGLERLHDLFAQAPILGSLIDPRRALGDFGTLFAEGFDGLAGVLGKVLARAEGDADLREAAVTAQGLAKAAELLAGRFTLVATNVPYLNRNRFSKELRGYTERRHHAARGELAAAMMEVWLEKGTTTSFVFPQQIFFLKTYEEFRRKLLSGFAGKMIVALGEEAWESFGDRGPHATLMIADIEQNALRSYQLALNASNIPERLDKIEAIKEAIPVSILQSEQYANPESRILFEEIPRGTPLGMFADAHQGISPADEPTFARQFWEMPIIGAEWYFWQGASNEHVSFGGRDRIICFNADLRYRVEAGLAFIRGEAAWSKPGIALSLTRELCCTRYSGQAFDTNIAAVIPKDVNNLAAILSFLSDPEFRDSVRRLDRALKVTNATITKVPFDLPHWQRVAAEKYPNGLPKPYSNDPTQWLFDGHPRGSADPNVLDAAGNPTRPGLAEHPLQVAVARLLGYRWPRQTGSSFMDCPAIEEPDAIERAGVVDDDGIVCLPALYGEAPAHERVRNVLMAAWGADWAEGVERACLEAEGTERDLEGWLADEFFAGHCRLFHNTPFVWHVTDGIKGGFSALVSYHALCAPDGGGRRLLEKLRDSYLGEWIATQRRLVASGDATAEDRLAAAEHLREELGKIILGEPPYDIFVRWKPLHAQPIGWEPDIDDGVRLNIRPFLTARPRGAKAQKACILKVTPGVKKHAGADRGGEPFRENEDFPWFWGEEHDVATVDFAGGPEFAGRRWNDFHYTRAFKQAARARKASREEAAE